jgi:transcription factor C subunit 6
MLASGSADGSLVIVNAELGARKLRKRVGTGGGRRLNTLLNPQPILKSTAYAMDYDRRNDAYRMTDDLLPEVSVHLLSKLTSQITRRETAETRRSVLGKSKIKIGYHPGQTIAATWPPEVGIHRVCWNNGNGIGRAGYLLSGTASGLARIDLINGEYSIDKNVWDLEVTR